MRNRTVIALAVIAATALFAAFCLLNSEQDASHLTSDRANEPHEGPVSISTPSRARPLTPLKRHEVREQKPEPPVFDEVSLEKQEVCRGEDNAIRISAHARDHNGTEGFLTLSSVHPETGKTLRGSYLPFQLDTVGQHEFVVAARSVGGVTTVTLPVTVNGCVAARSVQVQVERTLDAPDVVSLRAEVAESGELEGLVEPFTYHWDFGDGSTETTSSAQLSHSYEVREQTSLESNFIVRVTIEDSEGEAVEGSRAVAFGNPAFLALQQRDHVEISVGVAPPKSDQPEQIRLYHGYGKPVHRESVRLRETVLDGGGTPERETFARDYRPSELLGTSVLPARAVTMLPDLTTWQPTAPTAVRYVEVHGRTEDGRLASATFTLLPAKN